MTSKLPLSLRSLALPLALLLPALAYAEAAPPAMTCTLFNYAAFADTANDEADSFMFSGFCNVNVAPAGKPPALEVLPVSVEGEWSPKLKRASEVVKFTRAGATTQFTTWATCDADPFLSGAPPACRAQGMGGANFTLNIRRDYAPLARGFVNPALLPTYTAAAGSRSGMRSIGVIKSIDVTPAAPAPGESITFHANFEGGPRACPMVVDFGDGSSVNAITTSEATRVSATHVYKSSGTYKVTARALPGCLGSAERALSLSTPPPAIPAGTGELVAVAVGGTCSWLVNGAAKGTSSQLKLFVAPAVYSVVCKTAAGSKARSVLVHQGQASMAMFKL
jgi:hypothetical protein